MANKYEIKTRQFNKYNTPRTITVFEEVVEPTPIAEQHILDIMARIKTLIGIGDTSQDDKLVVLIEDCLQDALTISHLKQYDIKLKSVVGQMAIQKYNRLGSEGVNSQGYGAGVQESYVNGYTEDIVSVLKGMRRVRVI